MIMDREMKTDKKGKKAQTRFVVTREFGGTQTMQEAFEHLIEEHISRNAAHFLNKGQASPGKIC